jgi:hypothetical protein
MRKTKREERQVDVVPVYRLEELGEFFDIDIFR